MKILRSLLACWVAWWHWFVEHPYGDVWPVLAAVLPSGIGLISIFGDGLSIRLRAVIVFLLLLAVGGVQAYGQARNNRDRIKTEDRFADFYREIQKTRDTITKLYFSSRNESENRFSVLANAIRGVEHKLGVIANAIRDLASK